MWVGIYLFLFLLIQYQILNPMFNSSFCHIYWVMISYHKTSILVTHSCNRTRYQNEWGRFSVLCRIIQVLCSSVNNRLVKVLWVYIRGNDRSGITNKPFQVFYHLFLQTLLFILLHKKESHFFPLNFGRLRNLKYTKKGSILQTCQIAVCESQWKSSTN